MFIYIYTYSTLKENYDQIEHRIDLSWVDSVSCINVLLASIIETFSLQETEIPNVSLANISNATEMKGQWGFALEMYLIISYNPFNVDKFGDSINFIDKVLNETRFEFRTLV